MQFALLAMLAALAGLGMRRMVLWRRCGVLPAVRRLYGLCAWLLGGGAWAAMLVQQGVMIFAGLSSWRSSLPLHLCSMVGLLTLPMLLTRSRWMWHVCLYLGMPGALMALLFPAVLETPWPRLTEVAFHLMHCCILLAPLLPLALGMEPQPRGAGTALLALLLLAFAATAANAVTGGNYLFLNGSPIGWMNQWGLTVWRIALAVLALMVLGAEALTVYILTRKQRGWS